MVCRCQPLCPFGRSSCGYLLMVIFQPVSPTAAGLYQHGLSVWNTHTHTTFIIILQYLGHLVSEATQAHKPFVCQRDAGSRLDCMWDR